MNKFTLKQIRAALNVSQEEMARLMGISAGAYIRMEKNPKKTSLERAKKFAEVTGYNFDNIFFGV